MRKEAFPSGGSKVICGRKEGELGKEASNALYMALWNVVSGYSTLIANWSLPFDTAKSAFPVSAFICKKKKTTWLSICIFLCV